MSDRTHLVDLIENAQRTTPVCAACHRPTVVTNEDEALWLSCPSLAEPRSWLQQLTSLDFEAVHTRRLLLDPGWDVALAA